MSDDRRAAVAELLRRGAIDPQRAKAMIGGAAPPPPRETEGYLSRSLGAVGRGVSDLPAYGKEFLGDFFKSLMPTQEGAAAGGRTLGRVGDIATAATGGVIGPLGAPTATAGGRMAGLDVRGAPRPQPSPRLALPPPTVGTPGAAVSSTGQGILPRTGAGTMTTPGATPQAGAAPFVHQAAERPAASSFAQALASNDSMPIDRAMTGRYRQLVNPSRTGRRSLGGVTEQDRQIQSAVDTIIEQRNNLNLTDTEGRDIKAGQLPRTLHQFSEAIGNLKDQIFEQYDNLAKQVGGQGVQIPLDPAIERIAALKMRPEFADVRQAVVREADAQIAAWQKRGSYTPREAQSVLRHLNKESEVVIKSGGQEGAARAVMLNEARAGLMGALNDAMNQALQGPQYQALRNRYGALSSIEENVGNAMLKELAKKPGSGVTEKVLDFATAGGVLHGLATFNPTTIATTVGARAAAEAMKRYSQYLRSPNRAVTRLFASRARDLNPTIDRLSARAATELGEMRQRQYDANRAGNIAGMGLPQVFP